VLRPAAGGHLGSLNTSWLALLSACAVTIDTRPGPGDPTAVRALRSTRTRQRGTVGWALILGGISADIDDPLAFPARGIAAVGCLKSTP
jgi:hypothetical protein